MSRARMLGRSWWKGMGLLAVLCSMAAVAVGQVPGGGTRPASRPAAGGTGNAQPSRPAVQPRAPAWVPLPPKHAQFLDQVLRYWQQRTAQIERFRCRFKRWEFDTTFGPGPNKARAYSEGEIQYAAPDKGLLRAEVHKVFVRDQEHPAGHYVDKPEQADHWICDGKSVFKFDYAQKQLVEQILPPEYHGRGITRGPLPFLFGADAEDIKRRYWVRVITPPEKTKGEDREYWLEAIPKLQEDAADYRAIHIRIDGKTFLPYQIDLFGRVPGKRTVYVFEKREVNFSVLAEKLNLFHRQFYQPKLPSGWKKVVYGAEQAQRAPR